MGRSKKLFAPIFKKRRPLSTLLFFSLVLLGFHILAPTSIRSRTYASIQNFAPIIEMERMVAMVKLGFHGKGNKDRPLKFSAKTPPSRSSYPTAAKKTNLYDRARAIRNSRRSSTPERVSQRPITIKDVLFSKADFKGCSNPCEFKFTSGSGREVRGNFSKIKHRRLLARDFKSVDITGVFMSDGSFVVEEIKPNELSLVESYKRRLAARAARTADDDFDDKYYSSDAVFEDEFEDDENFLEEDE